MDAKRYAMPPWLLATACSAAGGDLGNASTGGAGTGGSGGSEQAAGGSLAGQETILPEGVGGGSLASAGNAARGATGFEQCAGFSQAAENTFTRGADIIIAIDQSSSMTEETIWLQQQLNVFANMVATAGVSLRVVIIVEKPGGPVFENPVCVPPPLALPNCESNPPIFLHINHHVDSNDALDVILATYPQYAHVLRPGVTKHVVVITDDTTGNLSGAAFDAQFRGIDPLLLDQYLFHAVVPFDTFCPFADGPSDDYRWLVAQRGGIASDLCLQDFQTMWNVLTESVTQSAEAVLDCEWLIPAPPVGETLDPGLVNVTYTGSGQQKTLGQVASPADCAAVRDGWFYDDPLSPSRVMVCPELCDEIRAGQAQQVDIVFGCAAVPAVLR